MRIERVRTNVELEVKLSSEEKIERGERAATTHRELERIEDEFAAVKLEFKGRMDPLKDSRSKLAESHETGLESQKVPECAQIFDTDLHKTWIEYRGDRYNERDMTHDEHMNVIQKPLFKPTVVQMRANESEALAQDPVDPEVLGVIHEEKRKGSKIDHTVTT